MTPQPCFDDSSVSYVIRCFSSVFFVFSIFLLVSSIFPLFSLFFLLGSYVLPLFSLFISLNSINNLAILLMNHVSSLCLRFIIDRPILRMILILSTLHLAQPKHSSLNMFISNTQTLYFHYYPLFIKHSKFFYIFDLLIFLLKG